VVAISERDYLNFRFHHRLYLHCFDRELGESVGFTPDERLIRSVTSCLLISNPAGLYCGLSPVWETSYNEDAVIRFVTSLALGGHLLLMSNHPTTREFIQARQSAYDHDRVRYPMYFDDNYGRLEQLPLTPKSLSATQSLREELSVWASAPPGSIISLLPDRAPRNKALRVVTDALIKRDQEAITFALFNGRLKLFQHNPEFDGHLRREISVRYTTHNCADGGEIPTGINKLLYYDLLSEMFPFYDVPLLSRIVRESGAGALTSPDLWESFLALRGEGEHVLFCDKLRLVVCGLCGDAGVHVPSPVTHHGRSRLLQAAARLLYDSCRHDPPAETASDVLVASAARLTMAIERGRQSRQFAAGTALFEQSPPADLETSSASEPDHPRIYRGDVHWDGNHIRRLRDELVRTYPSREELAILVSDSLSTNLNEIAASDNLRWATHQLIVWANADPARRLRPLVMHAAGERDNSAELQALAGELPPET
jgi:Effector-associated domain 1